MARRNDRYSDGYDDRYDDRYDNGSGSEYGDRYSDYAEGGYGDDDYQSETYGDPYDTGYADDGYYDDGYYEGDVSHASYREEEPIQDSYEDDRYDTNSYTDRYDDYNDPYGDYDQDDNRGRKGGKNKKFGTKKIVLLVVEIIVLIAVLVALYLVTRIEKIQKRSFNTEVVEEQVAPEVKEEVEHGTMKGYRNIALFGVDSTEGELDQNTRTDTIMIMSINQDTGDVKLVSVYRDTLLDVGGGNYNKANVAYARGGPEQAINMLNRNLDLNITDYVTVGYGGLTEVVNALGGIEINVEENEISHLNNYQSTMAKELHMNYNEVTQPGMQRLDGLQATAYCRIRYTYGWDYRRAARQREVLYAIIKKAQNASVPQLTTIANSAFGEIVTSYEMSDLIADINAIASYHVVEESNVEEMQNGFPQDTLRIQANLGNSLGDCVVPRSLDQNVAWLHEFLFGDTDHEVSQAVEDASKAIDEMTKDAVPEELTDEDHA